MNATLEFRKLHQHGLVEAGERRRSASEGLSGNRCRQWFPEKDMRPVASRASCTYPAMSE